MYKKGDVLYKKNQFAHKYEKFIYDECITYNETVNFGKGLPRLITKYFYNVVKDNIFHPLDWRALENCLSQQEYREMKLKRILL